MNTTEVKEINPFKVVVPLGTGNVVINDVILSGNRGVAFTQSHTTHPIGMVMPGDIQTVIDGMNQVFITCENIESARVLQDAVNMLVLQMVQDQCKIKKGDS